MAGIQDWYEENANPLNETTIGDSPTLGTEQSTDFQKWATGQTGEQRLSHSIRQASQKNPDRQAEVFRLQGKTGLPAPLIERNYDLVRARASQADFDAKKFRQEFPRLSGLLEERENAEIAHDDLNALQALERTLTRERFDDMGPIDWLMEAPRAAFRQGKLGEERNNLLFQKLMGDESENLTGRINELEGQLGRDFSGDSWAGSAITSASEFLPQTLSSLVAGAETGITGATAGAGMAAIAGQLGPQAAFPEEIVTVTGAAAVGFAAGSRTGAAQYSFRQEAGAAYGEFIGFRDEEGNKLDPQTAKVAAVVSGGINAGLELFGLETLVKSFPGGKRVLNGVSRNAIKQALRQPTVRRAMGDLAKRFAGTWSVETLTEVMQEGVTILSGEIAKQFDPGDFEGLTADQVQERLTETFTQAAGGMAILSAPGPLASFTVDYGRVRGAQRNRRVMEAIGEASTESKVRERLPEKFREIVGKIREGGDIESVQVPVDKWDELFQSAGLDPADMSNEVIGNYKAYQEAKATGGDLIIPIEAYAEKLAATEWHQQLTDNARFRPEEMTPAEAREWQANEQDMIQNFVDSVQDQPADASQAIYDDVFGQLQGAGRDNTAAEREAKLTQAVFRSLGERMGMDPLELYRQYNVSIKRPLPEILRTPGGDFDPAIDPILDRLRAGDMPSQSDAFGQSLLEWLRERGVQDPGGDLASRDIDRNLRPFERRAIRDDGMALDNAAREAALAGYMPGFDPDTVTQNDLLEFVERELQGDPVFPVEGGNQQLREARDAMLALQEYLDNFGVDLSQMDNAAVRAILEGRQATTETREDAGDGVTLEQGQAFSWESGQAQSDINDDVSIAWPTDDLEQGFPPSISAFVEENGADGYVMLEFAADGSSAAVTEAVVQNPGQGVGKRIYESVIKFLSDRGVQFQSDAELSPASQAMYQSLERSGYNVQQINEPEIQDNGWMVADGPIYSVDQNATLADTGGIQVEEGSYAEFQRLIEQARQRGQGQADQEPARTISGGQAAGGWRDATSIRGNDGQPATLYRGASRQLTPQDFEPGALGRATENPSAPLGVWFTSDPQDAARYGEPSEFYADIRNPAVYSSDQIPEFQSAEEAVALREQLQEQGHDGIIFDYTDVEGPIHAVAFDPEQVIEPESVSLNQDQVSDRLAAVHNLSAENLRFADEMGGLAVPSIGIVGEQMGGVEGFGEITLIGNRDLADPDQVPAFSSDAYTARFPQPEYPRAKKRDADKLASVVDGFDEQFGDRGTVGPQTFDAAYNNPDPQKIIDLWLRSNSVKAAYLDSIGESVDPVMRDGMQGLKFPEVARPEFAEYQDPARLRQALQNYGSDEYRAMSDALIAARRARYQEQFGERFPDRVDRLVNAAMNEEGLIPFSDEIEITAAVSAIGEQEVDRQATREKLDAAIDEADFREWVSDQVMAVFPEPFIQLGRKKVPYTLDNIVAAMTKDADARGREETLTFGTGQARAASATRFVDLEQMREAAKTAIKDPEAYKAAKEQTEQLLSAYREDISQFTSIQNYRGTPDVFAGMDGAMAAVARYLGSKKRDRKAFERALRAEEFNVEAIRAAASEGNQRGVDDRLVQTLQSDLMKWQDRLDKVTAMDANDSRLPTIREKITELQQQLEEAQDTAPDQPRDLIALGMEAAEALEKAPVPYFESKPARAVELSEFSGAVIPENASDQVRQILERNGIPFTEYQEGNRDQAVREFRSQLAEQGRDVLFQGQGRQRGPRGRITFPQSRRFFDIELLENADLSTFLHESGHLYLEVIRDLSSREDAPQQIRDDFQTILDWFGVESGEQIGVEQHEQWARGFEAYVMEGKAPSSDLRAVFARFKAWLLAIYRTVQNLNVELTDDVRGVMDRLVATDQEISEAQQEASYQPLFDSEDLAGMSPAEFEQYQALARQARQDSEDDVTRQVMTEYNRERQKWWRDARADVRDEVAAEVNQQPEYVAAAVMGRGKLPDGSDLPEGMKPFKMSKQVLVDMGYGSSLKRLPRPYVYTRKGGIHPDQAAEIFGYRSGEEMLTAMIEARPRRKLIEAETNRRMNERYGDMMEDGGIAQAAENAVHNDKRADVMMVELRKLGVKSNRRTPPKQVMAEAAQRIIGEKRVRDVQPNQYLRAEARAGRQAFDAVAAGDFDAAAQAKQRQVFNHYLYREAQRARQDVDKTVDLLNKYTKKAARQRIGKAGADYLEQIDGLLARYEFRRGVSLRQIDKRTTLAAWVESQNEQGFTVDIPAEVLNDARTVNYKNVPVEELRGIRDTVKQIEHMARLKNKLLASADERSFEEQVDAIVNTIDENHTRNPEPPQYTESMRKRLGDFVSDAHAWHMKPEFIFRWLDGDAETGPVWRALFKPLADAEIAEQQMQERVTEQLNEIMSDYTRKERAEWHTRKYYVQAIGQSMNKASIIATALNWGNQYNRDVMMEGHGWNEAQVAEILANLDGRDWAMVQSLWDLIDSFWPDIAQMERDLTGVAPEKVQPVQIVNEYGTFKGGYYPIKYDPTAAVKTARREERAGDSLFENSYTKPATKNGHTKERTGSGGQRVRLDLDVLSEHIGQVTHDLTHRRAIVDVNRLTEDKRVREAIQQTGGRQIYDQIRPWLQATANEVLQPQSFWEKLIGRARVGATVVNMGLKVTTAIVQPLGYLNSVDMIGAKYSWRGLRDFFGNRGDGDFYAPWRNMKRSTEFVMERSVMMQNRQKTFDRDVRDSLRRLTKETRLQQAQRSFFIMTGLMDMAVSVPTWLGAYKQAMEGALPEIEAGNESAAIDYADSVVRQTQSAGGAKDLARIQRGGEVQRSFVMFYSYFSVLYNQFARKAGRVKAGQAGIAELAASAFFLWFAPAILGELVAMRGPEDEDEWVSWAAKQGILYPAGTVVGVRDVVNAALTPYGYGSSPAFDAFAMTARAATIPFKAVDPDDEVTRADVKSAVLAAGYWGKLPSRQAWITGEYLYDLATGQDEPETPQEFVRDLFFSRPVDER